MSVQDALDKPGSEGLRVLLVEDHADSARAMARLLQAVGHRPAVACDVRTALDMAGKGGFDLVISDIALPDGTGHDLMRALQALRPIKGIALSGFVSAADERHSQDAGFSVHLSKPVDFHKLRDAITRVAAE